MDCNYTRRHNGDIQITQSTNDNLVEQILLNVQSLPNRARTSNSKVAIVFLKEKTGVLSMKTFLRDLLPQRLNAVVEFCISLCLTSYNWTRDSCTLALVDKKDVSDCIEMDSVVGVDQLVEKKDLVHTCLGK